MLVAGIDEAGRGAAVGPMVVAIFAIDRARVKELRRIGVRDSKSLTKKARERVFEQLTRLDARYSYREIQPSRIDAAVRSSGGRGLNALEVEVFRELIEEVRPELVYIDSPYRRPGRVVELMGGIERVRVVCEVRADANYLVVSAASIIAKVLRDRAVAGIGAGSGYPSDPRTRRYLKTAAASGKADPHVRRSWRTFRNALRLDDFK